MGLKTDQKNFQNWQCVGITQIDFSSKNQTIPMKQSEEKWEKPNFKAFLRGLRVIRGIKKFPKNYKIANVQVFPRLTLVPKIRQFW